MGKAPGIDDITPEMMRCLGEEGRKQLIELLNDIAKSTKIPTEWNKGIILPIYKKGDKRNGSNYRGITGKILARINEKRIRDKMEDGRYDRRHAMRIQKREKHPRSSS